MLSCKGFKNELIDCDELVLGAEKTEDGYDAATLSGKIKMLQEISPDYDVSVLIQYLV